MASFDGHCGGAEMLYGIPVSGDDDQAKRTVMDLVEELGFDPVDAGSLADGGRAQQPGSPAYEQSPHQDGQGAHSDVSRRTTQSSSREQKLL